MPYLKRPLIGSDLIINGDTGALLVEPTTTLSGIYGNGSDGAWHLTSNATLAKSLYEFASLKIDEGVVLSAPQWWVDLIPVVEIRCQTPIVLNGSIAADAVTAAATPFGSPLNLRETRGGSYNEHGVGPILSGQYEWGEEFFDLFPILGGGNSTHRSWVALDEWVESAAIGYAEYACDGDPASCVLSGFEWPHVVGMDRPYRFAAGGGGSADSGNDGFGGGNGGGVLLIRAPSIVFGAGSAITARGGDASTDGTNHDAGGGGGGHVEIWTSTPLSPAEQSRISAAGGAGDTNGYAGLDGVRIFEVI